MAAARGPYAKGKAKRAEILDTALDVIARDGYTGATVKQLADAVGLSQNGLLHYFGSKDALFAEILRRRDEVAAAEVEYGSANFHDDLVGRILRAVELEISYPGMAQLSLRVAGEATEPDHSTHAFIRERYAARRRVVGDAIEELQAEGKMSAHVDPHAISALLFASWDGLLVQWMYDKTIDVRGHLTYLLRALGVETMESIAEAGK